MRTKTALLVFALVALVQLMAPAYMAWRWEDVLITGQRFEWATAPVDPYDALRGRYVDLQFKETSGPVLGDDVIEPGQTVYALIEVGREGRAFVSGVTAARPQQGAYVESRVHYVKDNIVHLGLPFKRYYLREDLAPAAEAAYRKHAEKEGIALVRVKDGYAVVEELLIQGLPLPEYLGRATP